MKASFLAGATSASHTLLNAVVSAGKPTGLLTVPVVTIDSGNINVTPFKALFASGVFCDTETEYQVQTPVVSSVAKVYTLTLRLDPGLFAQPEFAVLEGVLTQANLFDYVVIGWIAHPGAGDDFSTDMFTGAPRAGAPRLIRELLAADVAAVVPTTPELSKTLTRTGALRLQATSSFTRVYTVPLLVPVQEDPVQSLLLDVRLSAQASLAWSRVLELDGVVYTEAMPAAALSGVVPRSRLLLPCRQPNFLPWGTIALEMTLTLGPGSEVEFYRIAATTLPASTITVL